MTSSSRRNCIIYTNFIVVIAQKIHFERKQSKTRFLQYVQKIVQNPQRLRYINISQSIPQEILWLFSIPQPKVTQK